MLQVGVKLNDRPYFDERAIMALNERLNEWRRQWDGFFARTHHTPLLCTYEELVRDYVGTIRRVLVALDSSFQYAEMPSKPHFAQQSDDVTEEWLGRLRSRR